jgi:hypothetical protein
MHPFFIDDFIMPTERENENNKRRRRFPNPKYFSDSDPEISQITTTIRRKTTKKVAKT